MKRLAPDFARDYERGRSAALLKLERRVIGGDHGNTRWGVK